MMFEYGSIDEILQQDILGSNVDPRLLDNMEQDDEEDGFDPSTLMLSDIDSEDLDSNTSGADTSDADESTAGLSDTRAFDTTPVSVAPVAEHDPDTESSTPRATEETEDIPDSQQQQDQYFQIVEILRLYRVYLDAAIAIHCKDKRSENTITVINAINNLRQPYFKELGKLNRSLEMVLSKPVWDICKAVDACDPMALRMVDEETKEWRSNFDRAEDVLQILWFKRYLKRKYVKLTKRAHETMAGLGLMM